MYSNPWYLFKKNGNICSPKDFYININSFIHKSQKVETTQMFMTSEWTNCGTFIQ